MTRLRRFCSATAAFDAAAATSQTPLENVTLSSPTLIWFFSVQKSHWEKFHFLLLLLSLVVVVEIVALH